MATEELTLPGFRHDTFSAVYPAAAASPVFARWPLERHGLRWVHPRYCYAHPLPDGRAAVLARDLDETAATLDALHPGDGERWRRSPRPTCSHFGALRRDDARRLPAACAARPQLLAALGPRGHARVRAAAADAGRRRSRRELFARERRARVAVRLGDARRRAAATARAARSPPRTSTCWATRSAGRARRAAPGGSPTRSSATCATLGGERPHRRAASTRVRVERGRVAGVELEGGERVPRRDRGRRRHAARRSSRSPATRSAAATPPALRRYRYGPATLKVDWALDGPIPWAAPEAREAGTVHVGGDEDEVLDAPRAGATRRCPSARSCCSASSRSPTRRARPAGKHTAWAYTHGPHERRLGGRDRRACRAHRGAGRALRAGLPRPHPRPPRPRPRRPRAPQREPRRRRRRRRAATRSTR